MNQTSESLAALVLNDICTRDELESILRSRKIGLYGRLRKAEMAEVVAGKNTNENLNKDRQRRSEYELRRQQAATITDEPHNHS